MGITGDDMNKVAFQHFMCTTLRRIAELSCDAHGGYLHKSAEFHPFTELFQILSYEKRRFFSFRMGDDRRDALELKGKYPVSKVRRDNLMGSSTIK